MKRPVSVKIIFWVMAIRLILGIATIVFVGMFFNSGGAAWESFKDGFLESALGIKASEFTAEQYGRFIGTMIIPLGLIVLSLVSIKNQMFKTLLVSVIIQLLLGLSQPLQLLLLIAMLILMLTKSSRDYLKGLPAYGADVHVK